MTKISNRGLEVFKRGTPRTRFHGHCLFWPFAGNRFEPRVINILKNQFDLNVRLLELDSIAFSIL